MVIRTGADPELSALEVAGPPEFPLPARVGKSVGDPGGGPGAANPLTAGSGRHVAPCLEAGGPAERSDTASLQRVGPPLAIPMVFHAGVLAAEPSASGSVQLDVSAVSQAVLQHISSGNGGHALILAMHPAALGHMEAVVSIGHEGIQVSLRPQTEAGHGALASSLDALKSELAQGGMNVSVTLRHPGSQPQNGSWPSPTEPAHASESGPGATMQAAVVMSTGGQIHLVL